MLSCAAAVAVFVMAALMSTVGTFVGVPKQGPAPRRQNSVMAMSARGGAQIDETVKKGVDEATGAAKKGVDDAYKALRGDAKSYKALTKIKVRVAPSVKSTTLAAADSQKLRSGEWFGVVEEGQVFDVTEERRQDGTIFMKLAGQDGWVLSTGIAGDWMGKAIVAKVADDAVIEEKIRSTFEETKRSIQKDTGDQVRFFAILGVAFVALLFGAFNADFFSDQDIVSPKNALRGTYEVNYEKPIGEGEFSKPVVNPGRSDVVYKATLADIYKN